MKVNLVTESKESQASNWIIAGFNRRFKNLDQFENEFDAICLEVAQELKMQFELKQDGTILFRDIQ